MKVLLLTDNDQLLRRFRELVGEGDLDLIKSYHFEYAYSWNNQEFREKYKNDDRIFPLKVATNTHELIRKYKVIFSLHCKQFFPEELVKNVRCINVHPGLNPYNRGWFPQVFSIINGLPCGATIHEIDEKLDHGPVICQEEVVIEKWDTSFSAYNKILDAEIRLLRNSLVDILDNKYVAVSKPEGNVNLKRDFDDLCEIDLDNTDTFLNHINKLRALTHGEYSNAFFFDEEGRKIFINIEMTRE
ncbi:hypothetical protein FUAX_24920 [Fulvitalea axinellae]|uniref:Formyl transferase n=1 Tax=Fulvitalea axinellae TaxID=1182444 RepID=A0AAU9DGB4_9BACT|nr:hypothetical protein FUAX_24920 [Fulvitalea axinellae]